MSKSILTEDKEIFITGFDRDIVNEVYNSKENFIMIVNSSQARS